MARRTFYLALLGISLVGLAIRVTYVLVVTIHDKHVYDALWYASTANDLSRARFFVVPFGSAATAAHPPLTSLVLALTTLPVRGHSSSTMQHLTMAVVGVAVIICVGLLGRAVAGPWVGLVAAGLAAVAPDFWMPSGILMSEALTMLLMALTLLAVVRLMRSPTWSRAALLGAACGLLTLARAELLLFLPALLVPAALSARGLELRARLGLIAVGAVATGIVLAPWVARNLATFDKPTYVSSGLGNVLLGTNCPLAYSGPALGTWDQNCLPRTTRGDESVVSSQETKVALRYARDHAGRLPVVVLARVGRLWGFYAPSQEINVVGVNEGRPASAARAGFALYYALVPAALVGVVLLRRRGFRTWFLVVPAAVLTVTSALFYGSTRFRAPFEVCLVVLAAPALIALTESVRRVVTESSHRSTRTHDHVQSVETAGESTVRRP